MQNVWVACPSINRCRWPWRFIFDRKTKSVRSTNRYSSLFFTFERAVKKNRTFPFCFFFGKEQKKITSMKTDVHDMSSHLYFVDSYSHWMNWFSSQFSIAKTFSVTSHKQEEEEEQNTIALCGLDKFFLQKKRNESSKAVSMSINVAETTFMPLNEVEWMTWLELFLFTVQIFSKVWSYVTEWSEKDDAILLIYDSFTNQSNQSINHEFLFFFFFNSNLNRTSC